MIGRQLPALAPLPPQPRVSHLHSLLNYPLTCAFARPRTRSLACVRVCVPALTHDTPAYLLPAHSGARLTLHACPSLVPTHPLTFLPATHSLAHAALDC
ncbi:hypothetical protein CTheo_5228 [Ceratobasidium theobromae]|uniref:Uncharacterized protein n=1 Tax=Ceratobasidium theobromae TaxID=1582974 RepID=A0A5N5QHT6_9AGAM|nr:hypothetical protein CTheo_5228 [Ceratobasidium theobromae]